MPQNREIDLYSTLDTERYDRERPTYDALWAQDVEIRFGMVFEGVGGGTAQSGERTIFYGLKMVYDISEGDSFESMSLNLYQVGDEQREAVEFGGGTLSRTNVLRPTGRIISVEEYARLRLEGHQAFIRRWGIETVRDAGYLRDEEQTREELLDTVRRALQEVGKSSRVLPGRGSAYVEPQPLPNMSME